MRHMCRKRKADGSSIYLIIPVLFLLIWILIYVNMYTRAADTVSDNFKTSLDAANLSVTLANTDVLLHRGRIGIVALSEEGSTTISSEEIAKVRSLFRSYEKVLQSNVGLNDDFSFSGGSCGWASNMLASGNLVIDEFIIYDIAPDDTVYAYKISGIGLYTETPTVTRSVAGSLTRDLSGKISGTTAKTPENTLVTDCTVYSKVSFPMSPPGIVNMTWVDYSDARTDPDTADFLDGNKRVSRSSTTSLKTSDSFQELNGNGWYR